MKLIKIQLLEFPY